VTTAEDYAAQQAVISRSVLQYVQSLGKYFTSPALSIQQWLGLLQMIYPKIEGSRTLSASNARDFFDSERELFGIPPMPRDLEATDFPRFVQSMEPARAKMSLVDSSPKAATVFAMQAVREVDNAGRRQIIHAVEDDAPATENSKEIRGWARVATGAETCAWCLMLVSRGPVYMDAKKAGLDLYDSDAESMVASGTDVSDLMNQWHPNCDCIVVPVYKQQSWPGAVASKKAEAAWINATKVADDLIESGKSRTTNRNTETLNALRRALYAGDISATQFAGLQAAA
jgi:hypothetical protein